MIFHHKPKIDELSLEEINRFFRLSLYDKEMYHFYDYRLMRTIERGNIDEITLDTKTIWGILCCLNSVTQNVCYGGVQYMVYNPKYLDEEKFRLNLITCMKNSKLDVDFVCLSIGNIKRCLLTCYNYTSVRKYIKNKEEYYDIVFSDGRKETRKFLGISVEDKCYKWDINNLEIMYRNKRDDGMDFYRRAILQIETIFYFTVLNRLDIYQDIILQIKYNIIACLE